LIFTLLFDIFCKLHRASIRPVFQFIVDAVKRNFDSSSAATLQDLLPSINQFSRLRDVIKGAPEPCNRTACASFGLRLWWRITPVQLPVQPLLPCCRRRGSLPFLDCISMHKLRVLHAYFKPLLPHLNTL
jgi:hypothetical protein